MDADRFDALSQFVTSERNRRGVVRALLGLAVSSGLSPLLAEQTNAGKKRKKRKKKQQQPCAPCQRRINWRCTGVQPNDTRCGECGVCDDGACVPRHSGCPVCQECDGDGRCRTVADDTPCSDVAKCLDGICNEPPDCVGAGEECGEPDTLPCCSGLCRSLPDQAAFCRPGTSGTPCFDNDDCAGEMTCVGYRCG
jgi:hypothetical protein